MATDESINRHSHFYISLLMNAALLIYDIWYIIQHFSHHTHSQITALDASILACVEFSLYYVSQLVLHLKSSFCISSRSGYLKSPSSILDTLKKKVVKYALDSIHFK